MMEDNIDIPDGWDKTEAELSKSERAYLNEIQNTDGYTPRNYELRYGCRSCDDQFESNHEVASGEPATCPECGAVCQETPLDTPIKVRWTGYARGRIGEYNVDFTNHTAARFTRTTTRQKTNVVMKTLEEAVAVHKELCSYDSDQRIWMNASQDRALSRVQREIRQGLEENGYTVELTGRFRDDLELEKEDN